MDTQTAPADLRAKAARDLYAAMTEFHLPIADAVAEVALAWYRRGIDLGWPEQTARTAGRFVVEFAREGVDECMAAARRSTFALVES